MFCTNCGEKLEGQALFCTGCGQKVDRAAAPAPSPSTEMFTAPKIEPLRTETENPSFRQPLFEPAEPEPARTDAFTPEPPPVFPPPQAAARPGGAAMGAAPAPAKSGNSKLFLWMGMLLVLLAVVGGLAYVAFRQFVQRGQDRLADIQQTIADAGLDSSSIPEADAGAEPAAIPEEIAPAPENVVPEEPVDTPAREPVVTPQPPPARAETPAPKVAPAPPPKAAPRPAPTAKASPVKAPEPVVAPTPPPVQAPPPKTATAPAVSEPAPAKTEPAQPPPTPKGSKVMLSGSDAYSPPAAPAAATAPATVAPKAAPAATSGDVFWNGTLKKNQTVTVDFAAGSADAGGQPLPGKPVRLETFSPVIEIIELPGPENGWKRFSFRATRDAKKNVTLNFHWSLTQ